MYSRSNIVQCAWKRAVRQADTLTKKETHANALAQANKGGVPETTTCEANLLPNRQTQGYASAEKTIYLRPYQHPERLGIGVSGPTITNLTAPPITCLRFVLRTCSSRKEEHGDLDAESKVTCVTEGMVVFYARNVVCSSSNGLCQITTACAVELVGASSGGKMVVPSGTYCPDKRVA